MLLVCDVKLMVAICCWICPRLMVLVGTVTLIGSASVANIAYAAGFDKDMTKLVVWAEVPFLGWARM